MTEDAKANQVLITSIRSVVTSSRNIANQHFFPKEEDNDHEIFQEIEKLKEKNNVLEEHNKNLENKVSDLEIRIESLYRDKEDLEAYLANFDDNERQMEISEIQRKNEEKIRGQYEKELEMLRESMGELGHQNIKLEIRIKEVEKQNQELTNQKEIWEDREKYYKKYFVHKDKYDSLSSELHQFKNENSSLDSRIMFRNMRVKELEKKIHAKEQKFKIKIIEVESRMKGKLQNEKKSAEQKIQRLNEQLSNAKTALSQNGAVVQDSDKM